MAGASPCQVPATAVGGSESRVRSAAWRVRRGVCGVARGTSAWRSVPSLPARMQHPAA